MHDEREVRRAAVAGMFYPDDPVELRSSVAAMLARATVKKTRTRPLLLVEPHAGYVYSGGVAAFGYRLIDECDIASAVVISPSHLEYFRHVSVFGGEAYETPLGRLPVDHAMVDSIVASSSLIQRSHRGHVQTAPRGEHALEVQLPFLQTVAPDCSIVPIVMGDQSWEFCEALGRALAPFMVRDDVLVIASSDLSHFHSDEVARAKDTLFLSTMAEMNPRKLHDAVQSSACEACGAGPIVAGMLAALATGDCECRILSVANSGEITGDHSQVVGYASAAVLPTTTKSEEN